MPLDIERIGKLVLLLGSDRPGEVVAAAAALCRTLKSGGNDLHDLIRALNGKAQIKIEYREKVVYPDIETLSPREIAQKCLERETRLNDRERDFISDMANRYGTPTEKQEKWLFAIHDKLFGKRR